MKKGERKQASMENVQGVDGWQSLARTVIHVAVQESQGHLMMTSRECQMNEKGREKLRKEAEDFLKSKSEYKDLLFDIARYNKDERSSIDGMHSVV